MRLSMPDAMIGIGNGEYKCWDHSRLASIGNVSIKSARLNVWLKRNEAVKDQKKARVPNL